MTQCICGGECHATRVTHAVRSVTVNNVPVDVCERCGEQYYNLSVAGRVGRLIQRAVEDGVIYVDYDREEVCVCHFMNHDSF